MNDYQRGQYLLCGDYTSYTPTGSGYFKKAGRWGTVPHAGDIIYFYNSSLGRIGHVGIVASAEYRNGLYYIVTIEGNTSGTVYDRDGGEVAVKTYDVTPNQIGGKNRISGFGTPRFEAETCSAEQLIAVARSQVGYCEKASKDGLNDPTANPGRANYTKYGEWYGLNPAQWCQMFVSWCAYTACVCAHDYVSGWVQDGDVWKYIKEDGNYAANEWIYDGGRWYAFDGAGQMVTGWFKSGADWYYMADDGGMCSSQWIVDDGKSYYLTASGAMATSAYIKSDKPYGPGGYIYYWVNASGVWEPQWDTDDPHLDVYELAK